MVRVPWAFSSRPPQDWCSGEGREEWGWGAVETLGQLEETVQKAQMSGSQEEGARGGRGKKGGRLAEMGLGRAGIGDREG